MSKSKWRRFKPSSAKQASPDTPKTSLFESKSKLVALIGVVAALIIGLGIAAYATNDLLRGHITIIEHSNKTAPADAVTKDADKNALSNAAAKSPKAASDLVDKYGTAADSPSVAAAIKKAEAGNGSKSAAWIAGAKAAADRYEALEHGVWRSGADPTMAIVHGYVPPGMEPQQSAMLYSALPHLPKSPRTTMTPEMAEQLAGGPAVQGLNQESVRLANQQMLEGHIRQRFGPIYVPPLHRDHNRVMSQNDNQMSLIEPEYSFEGGNGSPRSIREMTDADGNVVSQYGYDPYGRQTKISGAGPDADFGYAGSYVHQRSGLLMMGARVYNPSMGRFLSRDPANEPGFNRRTESTEPSEPQPMVVSAPIAMDMGMRFQGPFELGRLMQKIPSPVLRSLSLDQNPYTYVLNNPINYTDPTGLGPFCKNDTADFCHYFCQRQSWDVYWKCRGGGGSGPICMTGAAAYYVACYTLCKMGGGAP